MGHIHEKYDFAVTAGIVHNQSILLVHHRKLDAWLSPGGHIELDEHPLQALYREIEEEVGYTKEQLHPILNESTTRPTINDGGQYQPPLDIHVHPISPGHKHIALIYGFSVSSPEFRHQDREHFATEWFDRQKLGDFKEQLYENVHKHAVFILDLAEQQKGS